MELLSDGGRAVELSGGVEQAARPRRCPPVLAGGRGSVGVECVRVYPILNAKDVLVGVVLKKGN